ncbi:hypothetical protein BU23DRAFT_580764 [Bimuria novae-zelandiae CBS 107.79]|uniref:Uncharacterized protein n=1 Tax=Bimuria novae-zelandiae CBS 107.79 TaxID=1447943 RepID=A0A6A5V612_9PLEO|nr:hypothetical protein BU23DRAFT_580764 [Bimuria novae-zelandiae CBS 107.79]
MTVQNYQAQLDEHKEAAIEHRSDSCAKNLRSASITDAVAATLFLSIHQIVRENALAADHLFLAACVNRKDIPLDLLEAASPQAREDALKVLDRYALVTRRPAKSALNVHRLGRFQQWTQRTITQLLRVFPDQDHNKRSKWRRLLPHAKYALSHSPTDDDDDEERLELSWNVP